MTSQPVSAELRERIAQIIDASAMRTTAHGVRHWPAQAKKTLAKADAILALPELSPAQAMAAKLSALEAERDALRKALERIADESVFNQQRFAEDTDTDYFLRCFKAVKARARQALTGATDHE